MFFLSYFVLFCPIHPDANSSENQWFFSCFRREITRVRTAVTGWKKYADTSNHWLKVAEAAYANFLYYVK